MAGGGYRPADHPFPSLAELGVQGTRMVYVSPVQGGSGGTVRRYHTRPLCNAKRGAKARMLPTIEGAAIWAGYDMCQHCSKHEPVSAAPEADILEVDQDGDATRRE